MNTSVELCPEDCKRYGFKWQAQAQLLDAVKECKNEIQVMRPNSGLSLCQQTFDSSVMRTTRKQQS